ncbi:hypothetical protein ACFLYE_02250 [Chloroflexota bacterium]
MKNVPRKIIHNGRLFNSEAEADACSNKQRKRSPSYTTITIQGISITQKNETPNKKSKKLRRTVRRLVKEK